MPAIVTQTQTPNATVVQQGAPQQQPQSKPLPAPTAPQPKAPSNRSFILPG